MSSYFTKFKTLWDEYANYQPFTVYTCACTCGSKSSQHKEHVFRFLMGLNDIYGTIIGQILLLEPFPSLNKVCSLILQEEKRRNIGQGFNMIQSGDVVAMCVNNSKGFLGHQGHKNGGKVSNGKKDRPICTYYGLTSHINAINFMAILHVTNQKEVTRLWQIKFLQCKRQGILEW